MLAVSAALPLDELDRRCEEAAALSGRLLGQGHEVGLETGATRLRPAAGAGQRRKILDALAFLGFREGPRGVEREVGDRA